jgi:hypothetical protein
MSEQNQTSGMFMITSLISAVNLDFEELDFEELDFEEPDVEELKRFIMNRDKRAEIRATERRLTFHI